MPQAGFEPAPSRFLRPPPLPLGYCGLFPLPVRWERARERVCSPQCSEQDSNLQRRDSQSRASAGLGYQSITRRSTRPSGSRRELNPHLLGANQVSSRLDDGPGLRVDTRPGWFSVLREGIEPSTSAFGGPRSGPVELPQQSAPTPLPEDRERDAGKVPRAGFEPAPVAGGVSETPAYTVPPPGRV